MEMVTMPNHGRHNSRCLDDVSRLSETICNVATSLTTNDAGTATAGGIVFGIIPKQPIDILTLDVFLAEEAAPSANGTIANVKVYARMGDGYKEAIDKADEWQKIADTKVRIENDVKPTAIIPASNFAPLSLASGQVCAIYVVFPESGFVKVNSVDQTSFGLISSKDDVLEIQTGFSIDVAEPFPEGYSKTSEFQGVVHYQRILQCQTSKSTTDVALKFAINDEPSDKITEGLSNVIEAAVLDYLSGNHLFNHWKTFHSLELDMVDSRFEGRSDLCPLKTEMCSLYKTTVTFSHLSMLKSGDLQLAFFNGAEGIAKSVEGQSPIALLYVSNELVTFDFLVALSGVPADTRMNPVQRRYFGRVTLEVLQERSKSPFYTVSIIDEFGPGDKMKQLETTWLRGLPLGQLQTSRDTLILTRITSTGMIADLRAEVQYALAGNNGKYQNELVSRQLRPGEINHENFGDFFGGIDKVEVRMMPADSGGYVQESSALNLAHTFSNPETEVFSIWTVVCLILIVMSLLMILVRTYKDCFQEKQEAALKHDPGYVDQNGESGNSPEKSNSEIQSVSVLRLSDGNAESKSYNVLFRRKGSGKHEVRERCMSDEIGRNDESALASEIGSTSDLSADAADRGDVIDSDGLQDAGVSLKPTVIDSMNEIAASPLSIEYNSERKAESAVEENLDESEVDEAFIWLNDNLEVTNENGSEKEPKLENGTNSEHPGDESSKESSSWDKLDSELSEDESSKAGESQIESVRIEIAPLPGVEKRDRKPNEQITPKQKFSGTSYGRGGYVDIDLSPRNNSKTMGHVKNSNGAHRRRVVASKSMPLDRTGQAKLPFGQSDQRRTLSSTSDHNGRSMNVTAPLRKHFSTNKPSSRQQSLRRVSNGSGQCNETGTKGIEVAGTKSSPTDQGTPRKETQVNHLPGRIQYSWGNTSLDRPSSTSDVPKKHLLTNSQHRKDAISITSESRHIAPKRHFSGNFQDTRGKQSMNSGSTQKGEKILAPLEVDQTSPPNRIYSNTHAVVTSKGMPKRSNLKDSNHGKKPVIEMKSGSNFRNMSSQPHSYGKAGKIKFVPLKK